MGVKSSYEIIRRCYKYFPKGRRPYRVREQDDPVVANELMKVNGTLGGLSLKVRGSRAQTEGNTLRSGHCEEYGGI